ncbi:MAG: hypothetical protein K2M11_00505 [Paramuribaculum sp.]|nr:hypothetical protein [Paramuribaculum sp.]
MDTEKDKKATPEQAMEYPGVALNEADKTKDTECLQNQSTKDLNNTPRTHDL